MVNLFQVAKDTFIPVAPKSIPNVPELNAQSAACSSDMEVADSGVIEYEQCFTDDVEKDRSLIKKLINFDSDSDGLIIS